MEVISDNEKFVQLVHDQLALWKDVPIMIVEYGHELEIDVAAIYTSQKSIKDLEVFFREHVRIPKGNQLITAFKKNGRIELLPYQLIFFIEAIGRDVYVYTENDGYQLKERLYEFEKFNGYCRVNKSTIVNMRMIKSIVPFINGKLLLILKDEQEIEVSKKYVKEFRLLLKKR